MTSSLLPNLEEIPMDCHYLCERGGCVRSSTCAPGDCRLADEVAAERAAWDETLRLVDAAKATAAAARLIKEGGGIGADVMARFFDLPRDDAIGIAMAIDRASRPRSTAPPARPPIPAAVRTAVYERDLYRCVTCGTHLDLTLDHIVPWSKGGPDTVENLQTMCRPCNSSKGVT